MPYHLLIPEFMLKYKKIYQKRPKLKKEYPEKIIG